MKEEHDENRVEAYEEVNERELPVHAKIVSFQAIFKINKEDDGGMTVKERIVVHGNRDADRDHIRADFSAAEMAVIRMLLSNGICFGLTFSSSDIKGAFM